MVITKNVFKGRGGSTPPPTQGGGVDVKLYDEKMLILRCILPPPKKKIEPPPEQKLNLPPPGKSRTPCQETQLTGNNFNPLKKP